MPTTHSPWNLTVEERQEIARLRHGGEHVTTIARTIGVPYIAVRREIRRAGLTPLARTRPVGNRGEVPVEPLAAIVVAQVDSGLETWASICRRLGWTYGGRADTTRLKRRLGLLPMSPASGGGTNRAMRYATAVAIAEAVDADFVEVGL